MTQLRILDFQSDSGKTSRRKDVPEGPQGPVNTTSLSGTPQDIPKISKIKIPDASFHKEIIKSSTHASKSLELNKRRKDHRDADWLMKLPHTVRDNMGGFVRQCRNEFPDDSAVKRYYEMFNDGAEDRLDKRKKIDKRQVKHHEKLMSQRPEDFEKQYRARIAYVMLKYIQSKYPGSSEALG